MTAPNEIVLRLSREDAQWIRARLQKDLYFWYSEKESSEQWTRVRNVVDQFDAALSASPEPRLRPNPWHGAFDVLCKIAAGTPLTVAEFRGVGDSFGLAQEQIAAAALTFPSASPAPSGHDAPSAIPDELVDRCAEAAWIAGRCSPPWKSKSLERSAMKETYLRSTRAALEAAMTQARGTGEAGRETRG
jgi:hypothetical protein